MVGGILEVQEESENSPIAFDIFPGTIFHEISAHYFPVLVSSCLLLYSVTTKIK